jgi:hypothetical protein
VLDYAQLKQYGESCVTFLADTAKGQGNPPAQTVHTHAVKLVFLFVFLCECSLCIVSLLMCVGMLCVNHSERVMYVCMYVYI